jgi:hypothetical protein
VAIERFIWTDHAEQRLSERGLARPEVERAISEQHDTREVNQGEADWRLYGTRADGRGFAVIYDYPVGGDESAVRIVSVWTLRAANKPRRDR